MLARPGSLPSASPAGDLTIVLQRIQQGDPPATQELLTLVYAELRQLASAKMSREAAGHTLQPTALVHEAWLRLGGEQQPAWQSRSHFFGAAAEAMRRILIDSARRRLAERHGGKQARVAVEQLEFIPVSDQSDDQLLAVHEALEKFAAVEPQKAELVKLRYFAGLTLEEAAESLGVPGGTAKRWWTYSRAWLFREIEK